MTSLFDAMGALQLNATVSPRRLPEPLIATRWFRHRWRSGFCCGRGVGARARAALKFTPRSLDTRRLLMARIWWRPLELAVSEPCAWPPKISQRPLAISTPTAQARRPAIPVKLRRSNEFSALTCPPLAQPSHCGHYRAPQGARGHLLAADAR